MRVDPRTFVADSLAAVPADPECADDNTLGRLWAALAGLDRHHEGLVRAQEALVEETCRWIAAREELKDYIRRALAARGHHDLAAQVRPIATGASGLDLEAS